MKSYDGIKGADLAVVKPYGYYTVIDLYFAMYHAVNEIPDGAQIAIRGRRVFVESADYPVGPFALSMMQQLYGVLTQCAQCFHDPSVQ